MPISRLLAPSSRAYAVMNPLDMMLPKPIVETPSHTSKVRPRERSSSEIFDCGDRKLISVTLAGDQDTELLNHT